MVVDVERETETAPCNGDVCEIDGWSDCAAEERAEGKMCAYVT